MTELEVIKISAGIFATGIAFLAFRFYLKDISAGTVVPHPFSWAIWTFGFTAGFFIQLENGAGWATAALGVTAMLSFIVLLTCIRRIARTVRKSDWYMLAISVLAFVCWQFANNPELSVILFSITTMCAFIPTALKGYRDPFKESSRMFFLTGAKILFMIAAINNYNFVTSYGLLFNFTLNISVGIMLVYRKSTLYSKSNNVNYAYIH